MGTRLGPSIPNSARGDLNIDKIDGRRPSGRLEMTDLYPVRKSQEARFLRNKTNSGQRVKTLGDSSLRESRSLRRPTVRTTKKLNFGSIGYRNVRPDESVIMNSELSENLSVPSGRSFLRGGSDEDVVYMGGKRFKAKAKIIKFERTKIISIPVEMNRFKDLEILNLSRNNIRTIDCGFGSNGSLGNLKILDLSFNSIEFLPKCFFKNFSRLKNLDVSYNKLRKLNVRFSEMTELRSLSIVGNCIFQLPVFVKDIMFTELKFEWNYYTSFYKEVNPFYNSEVNYDVGYMSEHTRQEAEVGMDLVILMGICKKKYQEGVPVITFDDYYQAQCGKKMDLSHNQILEMCLAAIRKNHVGFVFQFLEKKYEFLYTAFTLNGNCLLTEAIEYKRERLVKRVLSKRNTMGRIGLYTKIGTPAHFCAKNLIMNITYFKQMIYNGLRVNSVDSDNQTLLHIIFRNFSRDKSRCEIICDLLLKEGLNPNLKDSQGKTALIIAARKNDKVAIRYASGWNERCRDLRNPNEILFDFNTIYGDAGFSASHYACLAPSLNMINDICYDRMTNCFAMDYRLKTPKDYVPQQYLTSKKLIMKYERTKLKSYFKDPEEFNHRVADTTDTSGDNEYNFSENVNESLGNFLINQKFLKKSKKRFLEKFNSDKARWSKSEINASTMLEDVKPIKIPSSMINVITPKFHKRLKALKFSARNSSILVRNSQDLGVSSIGKTEKMIEVLNKTLSKKISKIDPCYERLMIAITSSEIFDDNLLKIYKIFWKCIEDVVKILNLYKPITGFHGNFNESSRLTKRIKNLVILIKNILLALIKIPKRCSFGFLWRESMDRLAILVGVLHRTISFKKFLVKMMSNVFDHVKQMFETEFNFSPDFKKYCIKQEFTNTLYMLKNLLREEQGKTRSSSFSKVKGSFNLNQSRNRLNPRSKKFSSSCGLLPSSESRYSNVVKSDLPKKVKMLNRRIGDRRLNSLARHAKES